MTDGTEGLEQRLALLRTAFDASFAVAPAPPAGAQRGYLGIRLHDAPYALDLDEVASVRKHVPVTPLPSDDPYLLGIAGFGGVLTAVYDLGALLGQAAGVEPAWCVLVRGAPVAFVFHGLEGQLRAEAGLPGEETEPEVATGGASELVFRAGLARPVIRLEVLVARLRGVSENGRMEGTALK